MAGRIRSIKPEWLEDELLATASSDARTLSIALMLLCDDYGNGRACQLSARAFPAIGDSPEAFANSSRACREGLAKLIEIRFVGLYEVDGQHYFTIRNWNKHQKVDHPGKPLVPPPPVDVWKSSSESLAKVPESLAKVPESLAPDQDMDMDQEGNGEDLTRDAREPNQPIHFVHPAKRLDQSFETTCPEKGAFELTDRSKRLFVQINKLEPQELSEFYADYRAKRLKTGQKAAMPVGWQHDFEDFCSNWLKNLRRIK